MSNSTAGRSDSPRAATTKRPRDAFYKLMASGSGKLPEADTLRVASVCDLFLNHSQKHHVPDTFRFYKGYLQDFCDLYGTLVVQDLKPMHVRLA